MLKSKFYRSQRQWLDTNVPYQMLHWEDFDYTILYNHIRNIKRAGKGDHSSYNDIIIGCDTETSKKHKNATYIEDGQTKYKPVQNHICAWTISLRAYERNIVTLYGHRPTSMCKCIQRIHNAMQGEKTVFYFHNLAYDYCFLRKFLFNTFDYPKKTLNTKPHYPIYIEFNEGIILKDSLILAQRKLERWCADLNVEHQKAVGSWNYNKIRNQHEAFTSEELQYIEFDTLGLVECVDTLRIMLRKRIYSMPYTATGIPREEVRNIGFKCGAKDYFNARHLELNEYLMFEKIYHGGFCHGNRFYLDKIVNNVECFDFASSYPYAMFELMPAEKFSLLGEDMSIEEILSDSDRYAFAFKLIIVGATLKDYSNPMPTLQFSKCEKCINPILDNGRLLACDYAEIYLTDQDLIVLAEDYDFEKHLCTNVLYAHKGYLPTWLTDYVWKLYIDKCKLKDGDQVLYNIQKAKLNSIYGLMVQKSIRENITEDYATGDYILEHNDPEEEYKKFCNKRNSILLYQIGCYITSIAFRRLHELGKCCETWIYSDTDSIYGINWNKEALDAFNNKTKQHMINRGYGCVEHNGKEYWLGVATFDGAYSEFKVMGCKRYCGRSKDDGELHITVAGVPKKTGARCLNNDINNFTIGTIFDGETTGKLLHTYLYIEEIYEDDEGNETGDSVDLTPCDYRLDIANVTSWEELISEHIEVETYG